MYHQWKSRNFYYYFGYEKIIIQIQFIVENEMVNEWEEPDEGEEKKKKLLRSGDNPTENTV